MKSRAKQLPIDWISQPAPHPIEKQDEQAFQWDQLTANMPGKNLDTYDKLKILWGLSDKYYDAGRMKDWYKAERWARDMGKVLLDQETGLWRQYLKSNDEEAKSIIDRAYSEVLDMMELFDSMIDSDFEESEFSA